MTYTSTIMCNSHLPYYSTLVHGNCCMSAWESFMGKAWASCKEAWKHSRENVEMPRKVVWRDKFWHDRLGRSVASKRLAGGRPVRSNDVGWNYWFFGGKLLGEVFGNAWGVVGRTHGQHAFVILWVQRAMLRVRWRKRIPQWGWGTMPVFFPVGRAGFSDWRLFVSPPGC